MKNQQIEVVKFLAKKNVALLLIDNESLVAKSPDHTEIVIEDNQIKFNWLNSSRSKQKASLASFQSEFMLHLSICETLSSNYVIIPSGNLISANVFLMDFIEYYKRHEKIDLDKNVDLILKALQDIQLALNENKVKLKRRRLIKHNDFLVFYKNAFKIISRCRDFESLYYTFSMLSYFTYLYFSIPRNKSSIFTHGDLRIDPSYNFYDNPEIRNLGFQKDTGKIFIHDFGSSQTKSRIIFKDIVKIFNSYPKMEIHSEIVESYILSINETLDFSNKQLTKTLKISIMLCFFAEFSHSINVNEFLPNNIKLLYKELRSNVIHFK